MKEAVRVFENFLLPSYSRSEKYKQRINTFSVILRSQNIHHNEIRSKIDKYSEKFIKLLEDILFNELKHYMMAALPKAINVRNKNYCEKRHKEILNTMVINEDDSSLSGLEDEIMMSCQKGMNLGNNTSTTSASNNIVVVSPQIVENKAEQFQQIEQFKEFSKLNQTEDIFKPLKNNSAIEVEEMKPIVIEPKQIIPETDPSSNLNAYKRKFIPPINKNKERLKESVPFLRDFNPKFLKKENIDKKILRKFRNYVKIISKENPDELYNYDSVFWKKFSNMNLLPPMKYVDRNIQVEFKSFNIKFMIWLFKQNGTIELYRDFINKQGEELLHSFIDAYDLLNNTEEIGIIDQLKQYINELPDLYSTSKNLKQYQESVYSFTTELQSEEVLDNYLGDFKSDSQLFRLNNFETFAYPRCGKKFVNDYCESNLTYDMNVSMDSIQSAE